MTFNRSLFSSAKIHWATPKDLYADLNKVYRFNDDPCPLRAEKKNGLKRAWGSRMLLPARTDNKWFHNLVYPFAHNIIFLKGRLTFEGAEHGAPFPSMIVVFKGTDREVKLKDLK